MRTLYQIIDPATGKALQRGLCNARQRDQVLETCRFRGMPAAAVAVECEDAAPVPVPVWPERSQYGMDRHREL